MHLIWHSRRGRRRNHLWQIFWWSVKGCRFCGGSKIALSHWQSQWPLTQGWRYRAACDQASRVGNLPSWASPARHPENMFSKEKSMEEGEWTTDGKDWRSTWSVRTPTPSCGTVEVLRQWARKSTDLDVESDVLADVPELDHDDWQTNAERQQRVTRTRDERRTACAPTFITFHAPTWVMLPVRPYSHDHRTPARYGHWWF